MDDYKADRIISSLGEIESELKHITGATQYSGQALLEILKKLDIIEKKLDILKPTNLQQLIKSLGYEVKE
jgi:hypothetical protein